MSTVRCTMAQALVRYLCNQFTIIDGKKEMLFPGVFAIFGHGNVTCLSEALEAAKDALPTWRGQNEQSMALAAIGFAKAKRRRQIMVATSSIGPGALNMVTAAGVAPFQPPAGFAARPAIHSSIAAPIRSCNRSSTSAILRSTSMMPSAP